MPASPINTTPAAASTSALEVHLRPLLDVGTQLRVALRETLNSIPNASDRPLELARLLGVNISLTSRLFSALRTEDSLTTVSLLPGPVPLRQLLQSALAAGADQGRVTIARKSVEQFEAIIRREYSDRSGLDAVLGTMVPEMRRRHELTAKQAVFRGMEAIRGVSSEVSFVTFLVHPSTEAHPGRTDTIMVGGYYGLQRIRPGAAIQFTAQLSRTSGPQPGRAWLPGDDVEAPLIRSFCRPTDLQFVKTVRGDLACYEVISTAIGSASSIDAVLAERYPGHLSQRPQPEGGRIRHFDATVEHPCKMMMLDLLIHTSVWPGAVFDLCIYDTTVKGMVDPNDQRTKDVLSLAETVQPIGPGLSGLRSTKLPRHVELLEHVLGRVGWDAREFRGVRCQIAYPVYGSQLSLLQRQP